MLTDQCWTNKSHTKQLVTVALGFLFFYPCCANDGSHRPSVLSPQVKYLLFYSFQEINSIKSKAPPPSDGRLKLWNLIQNELITKGFTDSAPGGHLVVNKMRCNQDVSFGLLFGSSLAPPPYFTALNLLSLLHHCFKNCIWKVPIQIQFKEIQFQLCCDRHPGWNMCHQNFNWSHLYFNLNSLTWIA